MLRCRFSDALLTNLWRWLCSPAAALACSGLQRTVTGLMRKTLAQLVADLKRLGARVVAADAHSLILATGKHNLTAAVGCAAAVHNAIYLYMRPRLQDHLGTEQALQPF